MSGISFSAPTAWRVSESRASMPCTTVDRLTRTPEPPVRCGGGPLAGQDQADRATCAAWRPGTPGAWWRPRCCRSRRSRRSSPRRPGPRGSAGTPTVPGLRGGRGPLPDQVPRPLQGADDPAPQVRVAGLPGRPRSRRPAAPRTARRRCPPPFSCTRTASSIAVIRSRSIVEQVGLPAAGHPVHADGLAALLVPQDQFHRLAGLRDDPDRDRVADAWPRRGTSPRRASPRWPRAGAGDRAA